MSKLSKITVQGTEINIYNIRNDDYICLTDMIRAQDEDFFISDWLRNANTLDYLSAWEKLYNPNFNYGEFAIIRSQSGRNTYKISVKDWVSKTNAIGIEAKTGRYGGTYAHKDIAFNFGMWISPVFQLYVVKEYQRLKELESDKYGLEWNVKRVLSKANYHIHTNAVKNYILPKAGFSQAKEWLLYADEADLLNIVLFGTTAKQWRDENPKRVLDGENIRDMASINELAILSNLESLNSILIKNGLPKKDRFKILKETAIDQKKTLDSLDVVKTLKKDNDNTFIESQRKGLK
jgi:hypothetical protein